MIFELIPFSFYVFFIAHFLIYALNVCFSALIIQRIARDQRKESLKKKVIVTFLFFMFNNTFCLGFIGNWIYAFLLYAIKVYDSFWLWLHSIMSFS